jgi:hypothetical protein
MARALVEALAHQPRNVVQKKAEAAIEVGVSHA